MSVPATLDVNPQSLDQITKATGLGAFIIGGTSQGGGTQWGQNLNESFVKSLWELPTITVTNMLEVLAEALGKLPLEALQQFQALFPNLTGVNWADPTSAINGILSQVIPKPLMQSIQGFEAWVTGTFQPLLDLVNAMLGPFSSLLGGTGTGSDVITSGLTNLFGLFNGSTSLAGASSVFSNLFGDVGTQGTALNQIGELFHGGLVTPINAAVQQVKDWYTSLTSQTANLSPTGEFDASKLINMGNGLVPPEVVRGIQGITDMLTTLQQTYDGLASAYVNGSPMSNVTLPSLFDLAQQTAQQALDAIGFGVTHKRILDNRTNQPLTVGLDPTAEATFDMASLPHGTTLPTTTVPAGSSITGYIRHGKDATKGFVKFLAAGNGGSNIFVNVYKVDPSSAARTLLWASSDIGALVPNSATLAPVKALIPGGSQVAVKASDLTALEIVNAGSGTLTVAMKTVPVPNDSTVIPKNYGATRTTASSGGTSPSTLSDSALTHSGTTPWIAFGISNVPVDYQPPVDQQFTTNAEATGGDYLFNLPSWIKVGDKIDATGLGGAGGGSDSLFAATGNGGFAGSWADATWTYGTEIPAGTTQLKIHVGAGGARGGYSGAPSGAATTISLPNNTVLLTANGGAGGTSGNSNGGNGQGAGNHEYAGETRFAGTNVGNGSSGSKPGGGGGGGLPYGSGGPGADGSAWFNVHQP